MFSKSMLYIPILKELLGYDFNSVKYVYGSPNCLWTGGRPTLLKIKNIKTIEKIINFVKSNNIIPVFNFTNTILKKEDLKDSYCNELLTLIAESKSQVIISNDILHEYIKNKYPDIKQTASVIYFYLRQFSDSKEETEYINHIISEYDYVVLRSEYFIKNYKEINKTLNDISKLILIINSTCETNCIHAKDHYDLISSFHKNEIEYLEGIETLSEYCPKVLNTLKRPNTLGFKYIDKAINIGIKNIKLQGRQLNFDEMYRMLSAYFFNTKVNKKDLRTKIDFISAQKIQNSIDLQVLYMMKN